MALIKDGALTDDPYTDLTDDQAPTPGRALSVSLDQWHNGAESLRAHGAPLALRLGNDIAVREIAEDLQAFAAIILDFPIFSDGRAFSQARRLREEHGYTGEIRATGHIIRDQFLFLHRCGVNAIETDDRGTVEAWNAAVQEYSLFYQRAVDRRVTVVSMRGRMMQAAS